MHRYDWPDVFVDATDDSPSAISLDLWAESDVKWHDNISSETTHHRFNYKTTKKFNELIKEYEHILFPSLAQGGQYDLYSPVYSPVYDSFEVELSELNRGVYNRFGKFMPGLLIHLKEHLRHENLRGIMVDEYVREMIAAEEGSIYFLHFPLSLIKPDNIPIEEMDLSRHGLQKLMIVNDDYDGDEEDWGDSFQGCPPRVKKGVLNLRRLNQRGFWDGQSFIPDDKGTHIKMVMRVNHWGEMMTNCKVKGIVLVQDKLDVDGVDENGNPLVIPCGIE